MKIRKTAQDYILDFFIYVTMLFVLLVTMYPFLNSLAISLNHADDTSRGGVGLWPRDFTLRNYQRIFENPLIYNAYSITVFRTLLGTVAGLFFTSLLAYGLAHSNLVGRKFYIYLCLIPMYFGGGLIPYYFLVRGLGLTNNFLVYIIPMMVNLWNMIIMRTYFIGVPTALEESARIDGARYWTVFWRIYFPVSTPVIAAIALFFGVAQWNSWFDAYIFMTDQKLKPMQSILISIVNEARFAERIAEAAGGAAIDMGNIGKGREVNVRSITMATMIVTILPIVMVYPFLQKYFIKGIMVGSLKG